MITDPIAKQVPRLIEASQEAHTPEWREQCIKDAIRLLNVASHRTRAQRAPREPQHIGLIGDVYDDGVHPVFGSYPQIQEDDGL